MWGCHRVRRKEECDSQISGGCWASACHPGTSHASRERQACIPWFLSGQLGVESFHLKSLFDMSPIPPNTSMTILTKKDFDARGSSKSPLPSFMVRDRAVEGQPTKVETFLSGDVSRLCTSHPPEQLQSHAGDDSQIPSTAILSKEGIKHQCAITSQKISSHSTAVLRCHSRNRARSM